MFTLTFSTFPILFVSNTDLKRDFVIFGYTATYTHTHTDEMSFVCFDEKFRSLSHFNEYYLFEINLQP